MRRLVPAILLAALPGAASAHHGWTSYDAGRQTSLTVKIDKIAFANPHGELWATHDGKPLYVILSPPARMVERGLRKDALAVGKTVTVEVQPSTASGNEWKAQSITVDNVVYDLMR
ncbi:MAG: DUF6152 family protein [Alphaproteobacteria bacterium]|nr:DUF6152 family protein [Alphaproteobacteria bacterium]